jgi:hypothetical protein
MRPLLGELLASASEHIDAAASSDVALPAGTAGGAVRALSRVTAVMSRFADAFVLPHVPDPGASPDSRARAALDACRAVHHASIWAHTAVAELSEIGDSQDHPAVTHLVAAGNALGAGHDLLQGHFAPGPFGSRPGNSPWAPLVASRPVTAALITEIAGQARHLAPWAIRLSTNAAMPERARAAVSAASQWLLVAEGAAWDLSRHDQHPTATTLLHAIPANTAPPRQPPGNSESVPALCTGIITTAERLRHLAYRRAAQVHGPADVTSSSWQRTAQGAAITGHCTELILRSLSQGALPATAGAAQAALRRAADACQQSWTAWRIITHSWDTFTTGPAVSLTPVAMEIGDLVLRTGRLARQNPQWAPTRRQASPARHPTDLADEITDVLAALREATDALTRIATHDRDAVRHAGDYGHLFVPRRLLSDRYKPPHRYAPAPLYMTDTLRAAYDTVITAGNNASIALRHVAETLDSPPTALDALQAATRDGTPFLTYPSPPLSPPVAQPPAGQIEFALQRLNVTEPALLAHARQIDRDAEHLMTTVATKLQERTTRGLAPRRPDDPPDHRHHPAHLSALDTPQVTPASRVRPDRGNPPAPSRVVSPSVTASAKRGR